MESGTVSADPCSSAILNPMGVVKNLRVVPDLCGGDARGSGHARQAAEFAS